MKSRPLYIACLLLASLCPAALGRSAGQELGAFTSPDFPDASDRILVVPGGSAGSAERLQTSVRLNATLDFWMGGEEEEVNPGGSGRIVIDLFGGPARVTLFAGFGRVRVREKRFELWEETGWVGGVPVTSTQLVKIEEVRLDERAFAGLGLPMRLSLGHGFRFQAYAGAGAGLALKRWSLATRLSASLGWRPGPLLLHIQICGETLWEKRPRARVGIGLGGGWCF